MLIICLLKNLNILGNRSICEYGCHIDLKGGIRLAVEKPVGGYWASEFEIRQKKFLEILYQVSLTAKRLPA